jgi:RNA recognition motif-containing protein
MCVTLSPLLNKWIPRSTSITNTNIRWRSNNQRPCRRRKFAVDIRIYVGNLAKSTTEDEIKALFVQEGEVTTVDLVKDRDTGQSKGFAFVTMTSQETADKAIAKYNAYSLAGNELKVNVAKPRVDKPKAG